ncbi:hypothetical protein [Agromyces lapidis]|uniref:Uncharacterized protein n=1 Tax=Agromyces lapidis TaxID=279574 RepID=A0ABV5SMH2_9MICO|nr:hypothetical protein [Agromyces lapidis]
MTNLTVDGVSYDLERAIQHAAIRDLVDLKRATQVGGVGGISIKSIVTALEAMQEFDSPMDMFDSVETLETFAALVFLCKRRAGEPVTFDEACSVSLASVGLEVEDGEAVEVDPKDQ